MNRGWLLGRVQVVVDLVLRGPRGYLTELEVLARTRATAEKLREWERRGLLRPYVRMGRRLYRPEQLDVVQWLLREERIRSRLWSPTKEDPEPGSSNRSNLPAPS